MNKALNALLTSIVKWHRRRATILALSAIGDEALKDIGLYRSEIRSIATELTSEMPGSRVITHRNAEGSKPPAAASGPSVQDNNWKAAA